jgi:hypothetical protein
MACIFILKKTACFCVIYLALFSQVEATKCLGGFYCSDGLQHCCFKSNVCRSNCIGEPCTSSGQCAHGEYCCGPNGTCALNCVGEFCTSDSDCASGESCCYLDRVTFGKCARSCIGKSCEDDSHCKTHGYCCGSIINNKTCALTCI